MALNNPVSSDGFCSSGQITLVQYTTKVASEFAFRLFDDRRGQDLVVGEISHIAFGSVNIAGRIVLGAVFFVSSLSKRKLCF